MAKVTTVEIEPATEAATIEVDAPAGPLGLLLTKAKTGQLAVTQLRPNSPLQAKVEVGWLLLKIDDVDVPDSATPESAAAMLTERAAQRSRILTFLKPAREQAMTGPLETHMVTFERVPGNCGDMDATVKPPPFTVWFEQRGIARADFETLMSEIVAPVNNMQSHVVGYWVLTLVTCGALGWCCAIAEGLAIPGLVQEKLDQFNVKYPAVKGAMSKSPPGLMFTGPALAQPAAATPVVSSNRCAAGVLASVLACSFGGATAATAASV